MNYRTMVKGALAFSLSLIVGSSWAAQTTQTDVPTYGATFESAVSTVAPLNDYAYELGSGITNQLYRDEQAAKGWFPGSADDESKIIEGGPTGSTQALQLNTDASTLTNKFASDVAGAVNTALESEGMAFFETEVKFVASDTPDAGIRGGEDATKFAIYAYANEEAEPATTNLVVFHAYQDYDDPTLEEQGYIGYTNEVFSGVTINTEAYTKLRIVMRQIDDNGTPRNLFSVSINGGEPLASAEGLDYEDDIWFLTVEDVGADLDNTKVASLNFKGTGEIDNISVGTITETTKYAIDWTASDGVTVASAGNALGEGDTNFVAGAEIVFTATGEGVTITNILVGGVAQSITNDTVYGYVVGEADAIVTVLAGIAVEPLDETWTFTGNDGGGAWQLPTASTADTLFYSNLVVNIDATGEGRNIVAAWVGTWLTPSEAAMANLANWKFDYDSQSGSRVTGAPFVGNLYGDTGKLDWWIPITADAVRTAIATQSDIVKTIDAYEVGGTTTNTFTVRICPKDIEITNTNDIEGGETIDVDDWEENKPAIPTVITIALVNGATYTDAAGVLTFAAPEGYVVNSIYTNGVNTGSTTTFTTNGLTGTINIVAAAKKVRTPIGHKWYENPGLVVKVPHPLNDSCVGQNWGHDLTDSFVGGSAGYTGGFASLFSIDSLEAGNTSSVYTINLNTAPLNIGSFRGSAISTALNVMLVGAATAAGSPITSLPLTDETLAWDENAFHIWTDNGAVPDAMYFADGGQTLYANAYAGNQKALYKYSVLNGLKTSGTNLVLQATWDVGVRTRNTTFVEVGNKIFAYFHTGGTVKCIDLSDTSSTPVDTIATVTTYDSVGAAGSHLYVVHGSTGAMDIYDIAANGSLTLFKSFTGAELGAAFGVAELKTATSTAIVVTEDEETAIFGGVTGTSHYIFVAQYVEPQYTATYTGSENVIVTNTYDGVSYEWDEAEAGTQVACLSGTVLSFYPTEGNVITNVTIGGVEQTGFDPACYSITVISDTNLVVLAGASAADDYTAGNTVGAETLNADVAAWLNTKKGTATKAAFEATLDDDGLTLTQEYLLNTDPTVATTVSFTISSIAVGSTVDLQVTLTRTEGNAAVAAAINGTLKIKGAATVAGPYADDQSLTDKFNGTTTATKSFSTENKFFKAVIE